MLNLAGLRDALESSSLPRPITVYDSHDSGDMTVATLHVPGKPSRRLSESFFALRDIPDDATLRYATKVPWYGYFVAFIFFGLSLLAFPYAEWLSFKNRRQERAKRRAGEVPPETVPDPTTVQAQYDKQKPVWYSMLLGPGIVLAGAAILTASGGLTSGISAAFAALQSLNLSMTFLPFAGMGVFGATKLVGFLLERRAIKREGEIPSPVVLTEDTAPAWTFGAFLYPMMGAMCALMPLILFPAFRGWLRDLAPNAIWYYYGGVIALSVGVGVFLSRYAHRLTHYDLPADHYAHGVIEELTQGTKVRLRKVEVVRSASLNAYVSLWRTMGFTSRILREFSPGELRVVIAHEVGHFRAADLARHTLIGLVISAALIGAWLFGVKWVESHYALSREVKALLHSPLFSIFLLPILQTLFLGNTRRNAEEAADRFAVDAMRGDGEFVIQTLTKLHTLNASPHQLKPSDEALSAHPSLANRVAAIRRYADAKGV